MGDFTQLLNGLATALTLENLLFALIGCVLGTLVGALPGLGPTATISIMLPTILVIEPVGALIMLGAVYYGAMYGGTITAVLLDIPGEVSSVLTAVEGHQMAKKGRAGVALTIAAVASFIAGTASVILLTVLAPLLGTAALHIGPPEYFVIILFGLAMVALLVGDVPRKGYAMALFGFCLTFIGTDPLTGSARFTMGSFELRDGISFLAVAIGVFALADILVEARSPTGTGRLVARVKIRELWPTRNDWKQTPAATARGGVIGFLVGLLPGAGATIAGFLSYLAEKVVARDKSQFGKGSIRGLAATEASNNASTGGSLIPMLSLGLPGSATTAVLMIGLVYLGLTPGPRLFSDHPEVVWPFIGSMYIGNVMLLLLNTLMVPLFVYLVIVSRRLLSSIILVLSIIGVYAVSYRLVDVAVMVVFGFIGYFLRRAGYPLAPLVLALVLGPMAETALRQTMTMSGGSLAIFVTRPITLVLLAVLVAVGAGWLWMNRRARKANVEPITDPLNY